MRKVISIILATMIGLISVPAHAGGSIRLIYGVQDQYSNNTVLDRFTFKIIHDLTPALDVDFRATYANARNKDSELENFEIGTRYKMKVADGVTFYVRPELATIKITNLPRRDFVGLEVGTLLRPFNDKKIGLKIDHAWTTGVGNKISDGTLSRFQATYDVTKTTSVGFRLDARRGEPVEFNTVNLVYVVKY